MTFLSPWYLLGLLGIAIPLAIHMIRREKAVRIVFSTLRFLKNTPKKNLLVHRIQQWLLLLVRASMVALLALAFARPFITQALSDRLGVAPKSVVLLLDVSMSMGYGDYFERARSEAIRILERLQSGDEAAIITFADGIDTVKSLTTDRDDLVGFVKNLNAPTYRSTRGLPALRHADEILKRGHPDRAVYVISDFQPHAFAGHPHPAGRRLSPGVRFNSIRIADPETTNLAVTRITLPGHPIKEQEPIYVSARVENRGTRPESTARVSLRIDGKTVDTRSVDLTEKGAAGVTFSARLRRRDIHRGTVSVEDARFAPDNAYYFIIDLPPAVKVLWVGQESAPGGDSDTGYWFRTALGIPDTAAFEVASVSPKRFEPGRLNDHDVIVLMGTERMDTEQIDALRSHVHRGGGLLLVPDDPVEPSIFNEQFKDLSPALLGRKEILPGRDALSITEIHTRHPIIRAISGDGTGDFGSARFRGYRNAAAADGSPWIMRLENGAPLLLERTVGKGRVLLFTATLDMRWSNLPVQVFFLPLVHETVRYLARGSAGKDLFTVGEPVPIRAEAGETVEVTGPHGREVGIDVRSDPPFYYRNARMPGFYTARAGSLKRSFAVNADREESILVSVDPAETARGVISPDPPSTDRDAAASMTQITRVENGQRLWWWILLMVFGLVLVETFLANRTYR